MRFGDLGDVLVQKLLWLNVCSNPTYNLHQHVALFAQQGIEVKHDFVGRIFRSWGWKKPAHTQIRKFSPENIAYYREWVQFILLFPWKRLKFVDEAHFVSRDLYRRHVVGPRGYQLFVVETADLNLSYSLTLLIDLSNANNPVHLNIRFKSNNEWDFLAFVVSAIKAERIKEDDILIVDNAAVHWGGDTWELLTALLDAVGASYVFLPKYSPELNPCELVFANVKNMVRNYRQQGYFLYEIMLIALCKFGTLPNLTFVLLPLYYNLVSLLC
jgi:hypothetical protein